MLLPDLLRDAAAQRPDKAAAVFPEGSITYAELDARSDQVATRLKTLGVEPGDRVAMLWENALSGFVYFWGVLKAGAQNVDLPGLAGRPTVEGILEEAKPKAMCVQPKLHEKLTQDGPLAHLPTILLSEGGLAVDGHEVAHLEAILADDPRAPATEVSEHDVALVIYTSGTSGRPKGVMLSHDNLISNVAAANEWAGLTHEDSILVVVPSFYVHGRMQIVAHMRIHATLHFSAGFHFPKQVLKEIVESKVTGFSGVPYHFKSLMKQFAANELPDLKYVLVTGGALSWDELHALQEVLPNAGIHIAYGQTEASPRITWLGPDDVLVKKSCVGRPLPGVTVDILDDDEQPLPPGEIGEVAAGGPGIMKGYVSGDERRTGRIDAQGRLRTGDLGKLVDGYLYLQGRKSDMMKLSGERVFPQEIEAVIDQHPSVAESAIFARSDEKLGEHAVALVVLQEGTELSMSDLRKHCKASMSFVRIPKVLHVVDALPKTGSGKVNRSKLAELVAE